MVQLAVPAFRLTSSITMRSVAVRPEASQESSVWLVVPAAQMKTGMKRTVTTAKIIRVAKIGEMAWLFFSIIETLSYGTLNDDDTKLPPALLVNVAVYVFPDTIG